MDCGADADWKDVGMDSLVECASIMILEAAMPKASSSAEEGFRGLMIL